jgi:hypothetical protein
VEDGCCSTVSGWEAVAASGMQVGSSGEFDVGMGFPGVIEVLAVSGCGLGSGLAMAVEGRVCLSFSLSREICSRNFVSCSR